MEFADEVVSNCTCIDKTCPFCKTSDPVAQKYYNNYKAVVAARGSLIDAGGGYISIYRHISLNVAV
jgi:hypothetical protein